MTAPAPAPIPAPAAAQHNAHGGVGGLLAGAFILLLLAQGLGYALQQMRSANDGPGNREVYQALSPGEFAGTLMLGGFRGLACDLLWMRADAAKEAGRYYESVALFDTISHIQPRFEQVWSYMAWDLAYNLAAEVDDDDGKWGWLLAGLKVNVDGLERNPSSTRLMRHLAWMFHHKGDNFHTRMAETDWTPLLAPVFANIQKQLPAGQTVPAIPPKGSSNFRIASALYRAEQQLEAAVGRPNEAPFGARMIALALENDGNLERNRGEHLAALKAWLEGLDAWQPVHAWSIAPTSTPYEQNARGAAYESYDRNEGRLRRKAAEFAAELAPTPEVGTAAASAILDRRFDEARRLLTQPGWKQAASTGHVHWLDGG
jgi:hypothetical protein